ncbi:MAG: NAD(P)/FAD-dependent oxidoreductase [bacterium]|nr:NAD(P)/FAD-dependent oxidoreductase [bacterium]
MSKRIIICGGGAAGFFAAINIKGKNPDYTVKILEKSNKLLSKVKISGGGRCNVTNARSTPSELVKFYPRGEKKLYKLFKQFTTTDMVQWLANHGVNTKTENDLRMFPESNDSQTIINCFLDVCRRQKIEIIKNEGIEKIEHDSNWKIKTINTTYEADAVVVATGSSGKTWGILENLGLKLAPAVPSLFTFNIKDNRLNGLQGLSFKETNIKITNTKLSENGPLLITHWGLSGPAVIKLSAWGAIPLEKIKYNFDVIINFLGDRSSEDARAMLNQLKSTNPNRKVLNYPFDGIPKRYWERLCSYIGISENQIYGELSKKNSNKLIEELTQAKFSVSGKSTFKEEFVTCGGVELSEVNLQDLQSKQFPGLYFCGEVLNIDGITGGFNFQACWTTAWIISENI